MATTTNVNINVRMDARVRDDFERFCEGIGMSMSTAVTIFAKKAIREQKMPFELSLVDDAEMQTAFEDVRQRRDLHGPFETVEALMKDLNA